MRDLRLNPVTVVRLSASGRRPSTQGAKTPRRPYGSGYYTSGSPVPGFFRCRPDPSPGQAGKTDWTACLPRQRDDSLLLHICDLNAGEETPPLRTFALGHIIAAAGYDWTAPDLEDLTLDLDFAASTLTLGTDRWTRTLSFEIIL